jgi:hypothetical protein
MFVVSETKVIVFHEFMLLLVVLKFRGKYPLHVHCFMIDKNQALKYRSVTDIVRPIREIVRRREETTGHSVRPK